MPTIRDLPSAWRRDLLPAHFDGIPFHVESGSMEGGRRIVLHEYPKKEMGYAEDMGRKQTGFTVRAYVIQYPQDDDNGLYQRDYRVVRDALQARLDTPGPGVLQLPTYMRQTKIVVAQQYRMQEEERYGGYCVFDITFVERGVAPFKPMANTQSAVLAQSNGLKQAVQAVWAAQRARPTYVTNNIAATRGQARPTGRARLPSARGLLPLSRGMNVQGRRG
jgi:prophage DNA circulation protein